MQVTLRPGDVFLTRGRNLLSTVIRFCTRGIGESRTVVNHVGVVVEDGDLQTAVVVEALSRVRLHRLWSQYGPRNSDEVAIYRPVNLTESDRAAVVAAAKKYVGREYGYGALVAHFLDWCLLGAYAFRRVAQMERYPICSWLVAYAFGKADKHFGVAPDQATPDHIWDYVTSHGEVYLLIWPMKRIW